MAACNALQYGWRSRTPQDPNRGKTGVRLTDEGIQQMMERVARANANARRMSAEAYTALWDSERMHAVMRQQIAECPNDEDFRKRCRNGMLVKALDAAIAGTGADMGNIQLVEQDPERLVIQAQRGLDEPFLEYFSRVEPGQACCGVAMKSQARTIVEDVSNSSFFTNNEAAEVLLAARVRGVQSASLIGRAGQVLGVLSTHYCKPRRPSPEELEMIDRIARCAALAIEWPSYGEESAKGILRIGI